MAYLEDLSLVYESIHQSKIHDQAYLDAIEKGDSEQAQEILDACAQACGFVKVWRAVRDGADHLTPRSGYQLSFSSSYHVADSYGGDANPKPFYINVKNVREFPEKPARYSSGNDFSKHGFDQAARSDVQVARQVYDCGPYASNERDPKKLWSYPSDIYATTDGKNARPGDLVIKDGDSIVPPSRRFQ